ncbi:MAG: MarR family transcriptional regulator [Thermodesulfobacteriota bacterium]
MQNLVNRCQRYLSETLGIETEFSRKETTGGLPFFLHEYYDFYNLSLYGENFVVLAVKDSSELTPAGIRKHIQLVNEKLDARSVFLGDSLSSYNRKRLIAYKVPFIIPDNQLYLPDLALNLREFLKKNEPAAEAVSPATQALILYCLNLKINEPLTPAALAERIGYSKMTTSRAFDEIEAAGLAQVSSSGRNRLVQFTADRRSLWEESLPHLKTPVLKRLWIKSFENAPQFPRAGQTALAEYSMLAPPERPVYAVSSAEWKSLQGGGVEVLPAFSDEAQFVLEIWRYSPRLFARGQKVDPFSLYLSMKELGDERIESALEEMMENIQW